jgi:hypothetical protein
MHDFEGTDTQIAARELIRAANVHYRFDSEMVDDLLYYIGETYGPEIIHHPLFPLGPINAWAASREIDLSEYLP